MRSLMMRCALAVLGLVAGATVAEAGLIIDIEQVGPNVVATGSGSIDLTGLTLAGGGSGPTFIEPSLDVILLGPSGGNSFDFYTGATGPSSFGSGTAKAGPGSGDFFGLDGPGQIAVPQGYVSDTPLSGTASFGNTTFSSLGLTPGTYTFTWGTAPDQSLTVQVGPTAVPEPSTLVSAGIAGLMGLGCVWRRRRKANAA